MGILQLVDAGGEGVRRVVREDGAGILADDGALVVMLVGVVDGDAALRLAGSKDSLVDAVAIHALAAKLGQEGGMDVDHAPGISVEDVVRHAGQESCQDDEINGVRLQRLQDGMPVCPLLLAETEGGHVQRGGTLLDVGRLAVG